MCWQICDQKIICFVFTNLIWIRDFPRRQRVTTLLCEVGICDNTRQSGQGLDDGKTGTIQEQGAV